MDRLSCLALNLFILTQSVGVIAMSTPSLTRVSPGENGGQVETASSVLLPQQKTAASGHDNNGFMEDIGFSHFFTDIGLQSSASNLGLGGASGPHGFNIPHNFVAAGLGNAHLASGPQFGGGHLDPGLGLGFSASTKQEESAVAKVDPAIQGFIPADPLSFGGYTPSSSSFVAVKASPFVLTHPSPINQQIYKPPSYNQHSDRLQTSDSKQDAHSQYGKHGGDNLQLPRYRGSQAASSHSTSNLAPSQPPSYEDPRRGKYEKETEEESNIKELENVNSDDKYNPKYGSDDRHQSERDDSYSPRPSDRYDQGYDDPYQESYHTPDYDFHAHFHDEDEHSYAPKHQEESRDKPSDDYTEHGSSTNHHPYKDEEYRSGPREHQKSPNRYRDEAPKSKRYNRPQQYEKHRSESRPREQYERQGSGKSSDEPCRIEEKDGMTCKVCKDEEGGFSEHCGHSTRRGKDRVYANSRRGSQNRKGPDVGKKPHSSSQTRSDPVYLQRSGKNLGQPPKPYQENSYRPYRDDDYYGEYSSLAPESTPYAEDRMGLDYSEDFDHDAHFDPFAEGSSYDLYIADTPYDGFDEASIDFGHEEHGHPHTTFGDDHGHPATATATGATAAAQRRADSPDPNKSEAKINEKKEEYPDVAPDHFHPMDPEDNYAELTKMVSQFRKKDRSSCKQVQRNGMSCYVCQDPHGMEDEECMYAAQDPNGHDFKYSEEVSYGDAS